MADGTILTSRRIAWWAVTDRFGNPLNGIQVTWTPDAGGSVNPPTSQTGTKGGPPPIAPGQRAGTYHTTATAAGLPDGVTYHRPRGRSSMETQPAATPSRVPLQQQPSCGSKT